jgi:glycosyltransferase involved in cell wall biosynthesis/peptidoglycan/xylan/chitin deacetylase (PgdA/CDA1 family)
VPDLTVVIPTYNRARDLRRCLDALAVQTVAPGAFEVVVVDDGSADETAQMLSSYTAPYPLVVERQVNRGQPAALNRGIEVASTANCLFLDDDIVASPQLVEAHSRARAEAADAIVLGSLTLRLWHPNSALAQHVHGWWVRHYARFDEGVRVPDFWSCYSGNLSVPTDVLRAVRGFDETLPRSFDVELAYRLVKQGLPIRYTPEARGEHCYDKAFRGIVRDYDGAGEAAAMMFERHPELAAYAPLGDFSESGSRKALLRRALLAVRAPVWPLRLVDRRFAHRPAATLYDFLQSYCFWRGLRRALDEETWRRITRGTLILTYHAVARPGERASRFVIPARRLERQLAWLRRRRRPVISLDEYVACRLEHRLPPAGAVVLTFDDGYLDVKDVGLPALRKQGAAATVFLVSEAMDDANRWDSEGELAGRKTLSWADAAALRPQGLLLGAHTRTHPRLTDISGERAEEEIALSRAALEERLGPIRHFAYPFGKTSDSLAEMVARAGFDSGSSLEPGTNGPAVPLHNLRRLEVFGNRSLLRFALQLWLAQPLRKRKPS